eukprot:TRINITY_DN91395_c0_g1_i1.p1 TRINITY_DN91395_c0_g1~~TRINITY_DN91395_c0_g1_i1.p1  ORF type:complete len:252 (+),score=55.74 TRINITY_DN91395_c0_g1_i1:122-877(+)
MSRRLSSSLVLFGGLFRVGSCSHDALDMQATGGACQAGSTDGTHCIRAAAAAAEGAADDETAEMKVSLLQRRKGGGALEEEMQQEDLLHSSSLEELRRRYLMLSNELEDTDDLIRALSQQDFGRCADRSCAVDADCAAPEPPGPAGVSGCTACAYGKCVRKEDSPANCKHLDCTYDSDCAAVAHGVCENFKSCTKGKCMEPARDDAQCGKVCNSFDDCSSNNPNGCLHCVDHKCTRDEDPNTTRVQGVLPA